MGFDKKIIIKLDNYTHCPYFVLSTGNRVCVQFCRVAGRRTSFVAC